MATRLIGAAFSAAHSHAIRPPPCIRAPSRVTLEGDAFNTNPLAVAAVNEPETPPIAEVTEAEATERDGRPFLYAGMALIALSFLLSWWSLTKYRVYAERGVPPEKIGTVEADLDEDEKKEYHEELARYGQSWEDNRKQYGEFYRDQFGDNFETEIRLQDARSWKSGTIYFRGWSTWTGWFGVTFVLMMFAAQLLPHFKPSLQPWAWGFPWAGAIVFGLLTLMAVVFFFSVPDDNGDGYSQGVSWGNYIAIIGGCLATAGCVFEGMRSIDQGIAVMKARAEAKAEEEDDEEEEAETAKPGKPAAAAPPPEPPKSRLNDW